MGLMIYATSNPGNTATIIKATQDTILFAQKRENPEQKACPRERTKLAPEREQNELARPAQSRKRISHVARAARGPTGAISKKMSNFARAARGSTCAIRKRGSKKARAARGPTSTIPKRGPIWPGPGGGRPAPSPKRGQKIPGRAWVDRRHPRKGSNFGWPARGRTGENQKVVWQLFLVKTPNLAIFFFEFKVRNSL